MQAAETSCKEATSKKPTAARAAIEERENIRRMYPSNEMGIELILRTIRPRGRWQSPSQTFRNIKKRPENFPFREGQRTESRDWVAEIDNGDKGHNFRRIRIESASPRAPRGALSASSRFDSDTDTQNVHYGRPSVYSSWKDVDLTPETRFVPWHSPRQHAQPAMLRQPTQLLEIQF